MAAVVAALPCFGCSPPDHKISPEAANSTLCLYRKTCGISQEIKCNTVRNIRSKDENAFTLSINILEHSERSMLLE